MELLTFLATFLIIFVLWFYKTNHVKLSLASKIPGPPGLPILGNALTFLGKTPAEVMVILDKFVEKYGGTVRFTLGPQVQVLLTEPKDVELVLGSQKLIDKSDEYEFLMPWLGTGLLTSTGSKWFSRRKVITPTFHFKILEQFVEIFDKHSGIFVKILAGTKGQVIDVFPKITLCALDVICETAMGVEVNAQLDANSKYVQAVKDISELVASRQFDVFKRSNFIYKFLPSAKREEKARKVLHDFTDGVISSRREELSKKSHSSETNETDEVGMKRKMALLDVLLQSTINGKPLTSLDIREEVDTFVFEGHDTTTSGIAFCLYNIARHSEVQKKAFEEIRDVIGDDLNKAVSLNDLNNLNYLDLVIKESLRLFPSVPIFGRKFHDQVEINGKVIPAGTNIGLSPYAMGRDENIWQNPFDFTPERFEIENLKTHPYANIPFSAGSRNCIGQKFAVLEMKSTVSKVIRNFELSVAPGYEPELLRELILRPMNGVQLILKERSYK